MPSDQPTDRIGIQPPSQVGHQPSDQPGRRLARLPLDTYAVILAGIVVALALVGGLPKVGW